MSDTPLAQQLHAALRPIPDGALVPVEWIRALIDEHAGDGADLTAEAVGEMLGRAPSTIRGWCRDGRLPGAFRLRGREWRIPPAALAALRDSDPGQNGCNVRSRPADLGSWRRHVGAGGVGK